MLRGLTPAIWRSGMLCLRPTVPPDSPWVWFLVFIEGGGCRLEGVVVSVTGGLDLVRSA